jgi:hypothetical protein
LLLALSQTNTWWRMEFLDQLFESGQRVVGRHFAMSPLSVPGVMLRRLQNGGDAALGGFGTVRKKT